MDPAVCILVACFPTPSSSRGKRVSDAVTLLDGETKQQGRWKGRPWWPWRMGIDHDACACHTRRRGTMFFSSSNANINCFFLFWTNQTVRLGWAGGVDKKLKWTLLFLLESRDEYDATKLTIEKKKHTAIASQDWNWIRRQGRRPPPSSLLHLPPSLGRSLPLSSYKRRGD